jgi:hypothetical protein
VTGTEKEIEEIENSDKIKKERKKKKREEVTILIIGGFDFNRAIRVLS